MRVTTYTATPQEINIINAAAPDIAGAEGSVPTADRDLVVVSDLLVDLIPAVKGTTRSHIMDFNDLYTEAAKLTAHRTDAARIIDTLFSLRRDLLIFSECQAAKLIQNDMSTPYEEKLKGLFRSVIEAIKGFYASSQGSAGSEGSGAGSPIEFYNNIITVVLPPDQPSGEAINDHDSAVSGQSEVGHFNSSQWNELHFDQGAAKITAKEVLKLTEKIINECPDIFALASSFGKALKEAAVEEKDCDHGPDQYDRKMRHTSEITKVRKQELAQPDEVVDSKLANKTLRVVQRRDEIAEDQYVYVLLDISGSMDGSPLMCGKALLIALCKDTLEQGKMFYYRFFNDSTSPEYTVDQTNWKEFLMRVVTLSTSGGTNIMRTLSHVGVDIKTKKLDMEMVLITDATESIDPAEVKERVPTDTSVLLIADSRSQSTKSVIGQYERSFKSVHVANFSTVAGALANGIDFIKTGGLK